MDALANVIIFVLAVWLGIRLLRWAFPRLLQWWLMRVIRRQFGINVGEPAREKRRGSFFSGANRKAKPRRRGKKIPSDVGEYVEFEEVSASYESREADGTRFKAEEQVVDVKWKDIN